MPRYWFRQKSFGYGATPTTWQGWVLTFVSLAALFGVVMFGPAIRDNFWRAVWMIVGAAIVMVPTIAVMHAKTEGGWRWRNGQD
jgi:hypothetical protein